MCYSAIDPMEDTDHDETFLACAKITKTAVSVADLSKRSVETTKYYRCTLMSISGQLATPPREVLGA